MGRAYPVPDRQRWLVCVQHLDGTQMTGTSDADVLDRWRRLHWASPEMDPGAFKDRIAGHARVIYGAGLIGIGAATDDGAFLDALAAEGVLTVSRK